MEALAWGCGVSPLESGEWTWGELLGVVEAAQERQRRLLQNQALIAWGQAAVLCRHLAGEKQLPIYEVFPFWTTDEVNEMRLNEYRRRMERMAAKGGNGGG